jgi:predicted aspartyl protease
MRILSLAALAAALLAPSAGHAACQLTPVSIPVTMEGTSPIVAAKVAGEPVKLVVDSGAFYNFVDAKIAAKLKLKPLPVAGYGSRVASAGETLTSGAAGEVHESGIVVAPTFEFGGATFRAVQFMTGDVGGADGLLGQNLLHLVDDEYDLRNGVMRLIRAQGCEAANLAYWVKPDMTYSVLPLESGGEYGAHNGAMIEINGVAMHAIFDTGAGTSFITARAAARAGMPLSDPRVKPAGFVHALDRPSVKTWVAPFASIRIGDEEIRNTRLTIGESQASADDFDVLIGADFFLAHHVYVANSQHKIYFTYNGGPVFNLSRAEEDEAPPSDPGPSH